MKRVLVTGADGFVGRHLRVELGESFLPFDGDVLDSPALLASVRNARPDAVVHLAALSSVGDSWGGAPDVWRVNVLGTVGVIEAVRAEAPAARLLFVSSGEVYGRAAEVPTPETAAVDPVSPYGASKAAAEIACRQAAGELDIVIARSFPHTGPGQGDRFAVASWAAQLARLPAEGGVLKVGDLDVARDLTDVRDVCRAYHLLLDQAAPAGTYNVATGSATPLGHVVELLIAANGRDVEVFREEARLRPAEVRVLAGDVAKLRATTGWRPTIPLERTLHEMLESARRAEETERITSR